MASISGHFPQFSQFNIFDKPYGRKYGRNLINLISLINWINIIEGNSENKLSLKYFMDHGFRKVY